MNYYNEIKDTLIKNEVYKKTKDYSKNKSDLNSYYEVGRLLIEAQGGEERAKYGDRLIKEYSEKLTQELGKGYSTRNLFDMRKFYLIIQKVQTMSAQLSWSHYTELIKLENINEIKYYIYICEKQNISVRELRQKIKSNEYERIGYKEELSEPKVNTLIKEPIVIKSKNVSDKITEYALHNIILENLESFLKELGIGFTFVGHEVKIKIGNNYHYIDFLLYNVKFNCYVVVEVKVVEFISEHIGQVLKYMGYVDEHIKETFNDRTIGIIVCHENNKYVFKYIKPDGIFITTYKLEGV